MKIFEIDKAGEKIANVVQKESISQKKKELESKMHSLLKVDTMENKKYKDTNSNRSSS